MIRLLVIFTLGLVTLPMAAQKTVRVIAEGDRWRRANGGPVVRGAALPATEDLKGSAGATDLMLDCGPLGWQVYSCSVACLVPVCSGAQKGVTMQRVNPGLVQSGLTDSLTAWFKRELQKPVTLGVRGGGNPVDSVVLSDARGVHWAPALRRVLEGAICFRLSLLPDGPVQTVQLNWDRTVDAEGLAAGLRPGAYRVRKGVPAAGACKLDEDGTAAWVVVAPAAKFPALEADWKRQGVNFEQLIAEGASPSVVSIVRHAVLAGYAETVERP